MREVFRGLVFREGLERFSWEGGFFFIFFLRGNVILFFFFSPRVG